MIRKILAIWAGGIVTLFFVFGANFLFKGIPSLVRTLSIFEFDRITMVVTKPYKKVLLHMIY